MRRRSAAVASVLGILFSLAWSTKAAAWPTATQWVPIRQNQLPIMDDLGDGAGARDVVSLAPDKAAAYASNDGTYLYFRMRLNVDPRGSGGQGALLSFGWGVDIDTDLDDTDFEWQVMVDGIGTEAIELRRNDVQGTAGDPSDQPEAVTRTYAVTGNIAVSVADTTIDGNADYFLDWRIPYGDFKADTGLTDTSPIRLFEGASASTQTIASNGGDFVAGSTLMAGFSDFMTPMGVSAATGSVSFVADGSGGGDVTSVFGGAIIYLRVEDGDRNTDGDTLQSVVVSLTTGGGDAETVALSETGVNTGVFVGSIASARAAVGSGDGKVQIPGPTTLTATYNDAVTSTGSVNQTRTDTAAGLVDAVGPVLSGLVAQTVEASAAAGAVATFSVTASDAVDGAVAVTCVPASGATFALGVTTVSCEATDSASNTTTGTFAVTVVDTTAPGVTAPADVSVAATGTLTSVALGTATASDAVGVVSLTHDAPAAGFPVGTTVVTWTATDAAGNAGTATQQVVVSDGAGPVFTSPATPTVTENTTAVLTVVATDSDGDTVSYTITGGADRARFSLSPVGALTFVSAPDFEMPTDVDGDGVYVVHVTADDGQGHTATQALNVTVTDVNDVPPVLLGVKGLLAVTTGETRTIDLSDLDVSDPDSLYPSDFTLSIGDAPGYTRQGNAIRPDANASGLLRVPVTLSDGLFQIQGELEVLVLLPLAVTDADGVPLPGASRLPADADGQVVFVPSHGSGSYAVGLVSAPSGAGTPTVIFGTDGRVVFTASPEGAFAGSYEIEVKDTVTGETITLTVSVSLRLEVSRTVILGGDGTQTVTVRGGAGGDSFTFAVLGSDGTEDESGAIAFVADATAAADPPFGNPATSNIQAASVALVTVFRLEATDVSQAELAPALTQPLRVVPSQTYTGTVLDATGQPVVGAVVEVVGLTDEFGEPWRTSTSAEGTFTLHAPTTPGGHVLQATHPSYLPQVVQAGDLLATGEIVLVEPTASIAGAVIGLGSGEAVEVSAQYAGSDGVIISTPSVTIVGGGSGLDSYVLHLPEQVYLSVTASGSGFLSVTANNNGAGFDLKQASPVGVDLRIERALRYRHEISIPAANGFGPAYVVREVVVPANLSSYGALAVAADGTTSPLVTAPDGAGGILVQLDDDARTRVALLGPDGLVVYAFTHDPTFAPGVSETVQADARAGGSWTFVADVEGTAVPEVGVEVPVGGLDLAALACTPPPATIEVLVLDPPSTDEATERRTLGLRGKLVEIWIHQGDCDGGLLVIDASTVRDLRLTVPFDSSTVLEGDLELRVMEIFHARDPAAFAAGSVDSVPAGDIVRSDYANGRVTFRVSHLSAFSIGAADARPADGNSTCGTGSDSSGCFVATVDGDDLGAALRRAARRLVDWLF